jgi:hypothetical protein
MIYTTQKGRVFDLEKDFSSPERHILQKLLLWRDLATGVEEFRQKWQEALRRGWGDSGPVAESRNLQEITADLEDQVARRVAAERQSKG